MNTATTMQAANDNFDASHAPRSERAGRAVIYRNITDRKGRSTAVGQHALVEKGKRVVLWGVAVRKKIGKDVLPYRIEFKIGDSAEYHSYNLSFTGKIVAIGEKTVTIEADAGTSYARRHRLDIYTFNWRNWDFDAEAIARSNAQWMD